MVCKRFCVAVTGSVFQKLAEPARKQLSSPRSRHWTINLARFTTKTPLSSTMSLGKGVAQKCEKSVIEIWSDNRYSVSVLRKGK